MKIKELLPHSVFGTIATVKDEFSIRKLDLFLGYNYSFISQFQNIVLCINSIEGTSEDVIKKYKEFWNLNFPESVIIEHEDNRGHMFGTIDLEESILQYIKEELPEIKYLFKSMDDVITSDILLEVEVPEADFYYLPGFSYESIQKAGSKEKLYHIYETFESGFWTPQTTFFILNIDGIDCLYGNDIDSKYNVYKKQKKSNPSIKPWEISFDIKFDCETHLGRTVRNKKKYCLISNKFKELLTLVETYPIGDPAHKNIYFKDIGVCHYHFFDNPVLEI